MRYPLVVEYNGQKRRATKPFEKGNGEWWITYLDDVGNPQRAPAGDVVVVGNVEDVAALSTTASTATATVAMEEAVGKDAAEDAEVVEEAGEGEEEVPEPPRAPKAPRASSRRRS